ncbi:MAG: flagellar hook-associated protein FlgL [Amnibacterium sp.]
MNLRITSQQIAYGSAADIATTKARLSKLQQQASSGAAITKPSDDPAGTAAAMRVRAQQRANTQYATNIDDATSWLSTTDATLTSSENLVRQAIDLTTQAANTGVQTPESRAALATQLDGIRADLLGQANTKYLGRSVFAGTSDAADAFDASGTYAGVAGATVQRRISGTETVSVSTDGAAAFGTGTDPASPSVFQTIDAISAALRDTTGASDGAITSGLTALQNGLTQMSAVHATLGANYARVTAAKTANANESLTLETQRSGIEDADTTKVLLDLKTQEVAYQTALQVTAQSLQPTLMSFLR